ncbi:MAG: 1-phosphofructokinase [Rhodospirillum sp.]|nr:1-phosphofructokinase [Rhodospirillum sp.]MCF8491963.1 1-phosphofructokinase [Rhodospirillum sp.]MCF8501042.1 1-phosphofructokinase [Rhodospirillum sp.]
MTAPVITVTLNPAIDLTVVVPNLRLGEVHRAQSARSNAGGKGVNVAGCLADWGVPVIATGFLGVDNQGPFTDFFATRGITDHFLRIPGETRTNIKIADPDRNETTDVNLPGPWVDHDTLSRLTEEIEALVTPGTSVVLAGSLPSGLPDDSLVPMIRRLRARKAWITLDSSDAPLAAVLAAGAAVAPDCIKPNRQELESWIGHPLPDTAALLAAARALVAQGIALVVVSLGAEGALFVTRDLALRGWLPPRNALSTVGAGDAMVAGLVSAHRTGDSLETTARLGLAFATAKLETVGPHLPKPETVRTLAQEARITPVPPLA